MRTTIRATSLIALTICVDLWAGCASPQDKPAGSVTTAWRDHNRTEAPPPREDRTGPATRTGVSDDSPPPPEGDILAVVDGRPIARSRVVELLLRSHGIGVLEQLIGLEAAKRLAEEKGFAVEESDVDFEFDLALRRLSDPGSEGTSGAFDRSAAERLLESVLIDRNISREELFVTLRRNAYLREIADAELTVTEDQLRAEFDRTYGQRVEIRHIQLASLQEATRLRERLVAGEDFGELAGRYSANLASGRRKGLLDPFSAGDEEVPELFRKVAFALGQGEVSDIVRVGEWYHLIKLERVLPAETRDFQAIRGDLERRRRERLTEARMRELYEELLRESSVVINDPALRAQFEQRRPKRSQ